ncbi:MAG TPA: hypothetical protein VM285_17670 [Polyangia bacterium]|nr:hypothetical protein [Polyangia bacterium]
MHTCFVTRHREYHTRAGTCVAVRDRLSTAWIAGHRAVGLGLVGRDDTAPYMGLPLEFFDQSTRVVTSAVVDIARPGRTVVEAYSLVAGLLPT